MKEIDPKIYINLSLKTLGLKNGNEQFYVVGANSEFATTLEALKNKNNVYGVSRNTIPYLNENDQIQLKTT